MSTFKSTIVVLAALIVALLFVAPALAQNGPEAVGEVTLSQYAQGNVNALGSNRIATFYLASNAPVGFINFKSVRAYTTDSYVWVNGVAVRPMVRLTATSECVGSVMVKAGDKVEVIDTNNAGYVYQSSNTYVSLNTYSVFLPGLSH